MRCYQETGSHSSTSAISSPDPAFLLVSNLAKFDEKHRDSETHIMFKYDRLTMKNEHSAHAQQIGIGLSPRSWCGLKEKRVLHEDEIGTSAVGCIKVGPQCVRVTYELYFVR